MKKKPKFKRLLRALLVWLPVFVLAGCAGSISIPIDDYFTESCRLPCWYGITPGQTTHAEAEDILRALPGFRKLYGSNWEWGVSKTGWINGMPPGYPARGTLTAEQGVVVHMRFDLPTSYPLTLGQVVDLYGPPEFYQTYYIPAYHVPLESDYWSVHFYYFQQGFTVGAQARPERRGEVQPDLEVTSIAVYEPTTLDGYFQKWNLSSSPDSRPLPWPGFHNQVVP